MFSVNLLVSTLSYKIEDQDENEFYENEFRRLKCDEDQEINDDRLTALQNRMQTEAIDAYIVTSFDPETKDLSEGSLKLISGLSVLSGEAAVCDFCHGLKLLNFSMRSKYFLDNFKNCSVVD